MTTADVVVEIGFTAPSTGAYLHLDDTARGKLDTATLAPADLWVDVSAYVSAVQTRRGATRADGPNLRYEPGTATVVLRNEDRRFDPTNTAGPYVTAGVTQVEPMRPIRVRATWNGVSYPLWRGYIDEWRIGYDGPNVSTATVTCFDAFTVFASYDRTAIAAVGAGETSGARVGRILDSVGWPSADRVVATGKSTVQATTLADNVLTELLLTSDSELGELYIDAEGHVVFRDRHAALTDTRSNTSQATFGDLSPELRYADVAIDYSRSSLYNLITIGRAGGTAQTVENAASRTAYLTRTYRRTDLIMESDTEAASQATFLLGQAAEPELRFSSMVVKPRRDSDGAGLLFPQALGRLIGDRITVKRRPPGGGAVISRDVFVRGIEHRIAAGATDWETTFVFQSATRFDFFVLNSSVLGVLDTSALAY